MVFAWLPEPRLHLHPRLTWLIECSFDLAVSAMYRREREHPRNFNLHPGTLIISNHKRESDVPILATVLCPREGVRITEPLPFFAAREDLFYRDALANLLDSWPQPLKRLLGYIPLGWLFRNVRTRPMRRLHEFTLGETLHELLTAGFGDADPTTILNARGRREITAALGELPARLTDIEPRRLGKLRRSRWGLRRLQVSALRKIEPAFRATITAQLDHFAALLGAGYSVYFAPEGAASASGEFGRIRAGCRRLCRMAGASVSLLPSALSYDALGPGRLRVIVFVGDPLHDLDLSDPRRFATNLRDAILRLYAVNPSHLTASFLCAGPMQFTTQDFVTWLRRATTAISAAGLTLDPLLLRVPAEAIAEERLSWLQRKKLILREAGGWHNHWPRDAEPGWRTPAAVVRYLANSLTDLLPDLVRSLKP